MGLENALSAMRRLPPHAVEANLSALVELSPELTEELLANVDQPLAVANDPKVDKPFLLCDYNRDSDSYRSPWTNEYFPPLEDGAQPPAKLRALEVRLHEVFGMYREQYYEGGVSSVYLWELDEAEFGGCFLVHKAGDKEGKKGLLSAGYWDAIHVFEVRSADAGAANTTYNLTSTVLLYLESKSGAEGGGFSLAGSLTRQVEEERPTKEGHVVNLGRLIEDMETRLRGTLNEVYFGKTRQVLSALRTASSEIAPTNAKSKQTSLMQEMMKRQSMRATHQSALSGDTVLKPSTVLEES
mmetsp:Transcript_17865/g.58430  ORF Transcript_17865/g.58430 Transcript_17865/m.58430 type:complete len:298 (-) Transcript_17865:84-977(-)|eukprot:CAMPEP_0170143864 /NCGR_PEP_ID=MMETSP0033_2-20121228/13178_1 /TAXON_ID=195969 /ORGANISM="Dolichomastix tenuilepis, Strain CCMP3274" /LENGTH=297 /DNA_ID=CAMNT_0010380335 /DNA_START=68 /DNA_END=961 /DNA_ORIENTATION=+